MGLLKFKITIFFILLIACVFICSCSKLFKGNSAKIFLENPFITTDTVWQGEITIKGVAVVKEGVVLTILPGTIVKFVRIDLNKDNVGDGELVVEGKLIAQGKPDNPIVFTSAEKKPDKKDWTYIYLERNCGFVVENCIFSYAFTGLQIHYSQGEIINNIFEKNFEGLRYSTNKILIQHNTFRNNDYGIRFESRRSDAEISYNEITQNNYGIFAVMRSEEKENKIYNNNIYNNQKYNFLMGMEQTSDLSAANNWWGTINEEEINDLIFDQDDESTVGVVKYFPFLKTKVENAGANINLEGTGRS